MAYVWGLTLHIPMSGHENLYVSIMHVVLKAYCLDISNIIILLLFLLLIKLNGPPNLQIYTEDNSNLLPSG